MIERADADGDLLVSEEEFYNLITKKAHWYVYRSFGTFAYLAFIILLSSIFQWQHNFDKSNDS
jgi:hypothetical protein